MTISLHSAGFVPEIVAFDPAVDLALRHKRRALLERMFGQPSEPVRLGRYVLLEILGEGGMGIVYAAHDPKLERKVALKLLRAQSHEDARTLVGEARAMAQLVDPNIVRVYEIADAEALTFIVMEYVDGITLKQWLVERPRSRAEILAAFRAAGLGLIAAHAQGLVHRDFKPSNVMVARDGRVLVMDFGLARRDAQRSNSGERESMHTSALAGTPAYMAPEQLRGLAVGSQADQFSFCVALWEALCGERPFAGAALASVSDAAHERALLPKGGRRLPAWIRRALVRGLDVEPARRWPSIDALLDALGRDPTRRRTRSGLVAATLGLGLVLSLGEGRAEQRLDQRRRASAAAACEAQGRAIDDDWNEVTRAGLEQLLDAEAHPVAWTHSRTLLDNYAREWSATRTQLCLRAQVEHELAVDLYESAIDCLERRRASFHAVVHLPAGATKPLERVPVIAARLDPLSSCRDERVLARWVSPPRDTYARVDALRKRMLTARLTGDIEDLELALDDAEQLGWRPLVAEGRLLLADQQHRAGQPEAARTSTEQAWRDASVSGDELMEIAAATSLLWLEGVRLGNLDRGDQWAELATGLVERLQLRGSIVDADLLTRLGALARKRGAYADALAALTQALRILESELPPTHQTIGHIHRMFGVIHAEQGLLDESLAHYRHAREIYVAVSGVETLGVAEIKANIAANLLYLGHHEQALVILQDVRRVMESSTPRPPNNLGLRYDDIGQALLGLGRHDDALAHHRLALATNEQVYGPEHPRVAYSLRGIGNALAAKGELVEALDWLERAMRMEEAKFGADSPYLAGTLGDLAEVHLARGDAATALVLHQRALDIRARKLASDSPLLADSLLGIGRAQLELGDSDTAVDALVRALAILDERPGNPQTHARIRATLARARAL